MSNYPMLTCHFRVEWGGERTGFTEVTGLTIERQIVEYREGQSPEYKTTKMPGLEKSHTIVLKRGIMAGDKDFFQWINTIALNQVERRDVVISLLNENHEPVMTWKVIRAWPVKWEGPTLKADGSEVAIETLELAHEGITLLN
jgi:phage tail-like protein